MLRGRAKCDCGLVHHDSIMFSTETRALRQHPKLRNKPRVPLDVSWFFATTFGAKGNDVEITVVGPVAHFLSPRPSSHSAERRCPPSHNRLPLAPAEIRESFRESSFHASSYARWTKGIEPKADATIALALIKVNESLVLSRWHSRAICPSEKLLKIRLERPKASRADAVSPSSFKIPMNEFGQTQEIYFLGFIAGGDVRLPAPANLWAAQGGGRCHPRRRQIPGD